MAGSTDGGGESVCLLVDQLCLGLHRLLQHRPRLRRPHLHLRHQDDLSHQRRLRGVCLRPSYAWLCRHSLGLHHELPIPVISNIKECHLAFFPRKNSTSEGDIAPGQLHPRMPSRSSPRSSSAFVEPWLSSSSSENHHYYYHTMPGSPTTQSISK